MEEAGPTEMVLQRVNECSRYESVGHATTLLPKRRGLVFNDNGADQIRYAVKVSATKYEARKQEVYDME